MELIVSVFTPVMYIWAFFACLLLFRLGYAFVVFLFTGKIYNYTSSAWNSEEVDAWFKMLFLGKNFKCTFIDCFAFAAMLTALYFAVAGICLTIYYLSVLFMPYSLWLMIGVGIVSALVLVSVFIRTMITKKRNFVNKLSGSEQESLFKIVSEGE